MKRGCEITVSMEKEDLSFKMNERSSFCLPFRRGYIAKGEVYQRYIHQSVELVRKTCQEMRAPYTLILVDTLEKAKTLPGAFNNWAVFYQGKFVTVNLLDAAALKRFLKKGGYGVSAK